MKNTLFITTALLVLFAAEPSYATENGLFAGTDASIVRLTLDGVTPFTAIDTGWITSSGAHRTTNQNYFTGYSDTQPAYLGQFNSYFTFIIGAAAPVSPYTSATITFGSGNSLGSGPYTLSLFDVSASAAALDTERVAGDQVGQALYTDLGSGNLYGQMSLGGPYFSGQTITLTLNQTFLNRVNAGLLTSISIGGTLNPITASAAPEPATWGMMAAGFGLVGFVIRRRQGALAFA